MHFPKPTAEDIQESRRAFEAHESRDLFYRVATELVELVLRGATSLSTVEAAAVLLQTWNRAYYQYRSFDQQHFSDVERLLATYETPLAAFRARPIESLGEGDFETVEDVFEAFEEVLGPVGTAKCLHLLAPRFFPLWDRAIAWSYGVALQGRGTNVGRYRRFMEMTKSQCESLGGEQVMGIRLLKALDEYNYCKFTKRWT